MTLNFRGTRPAWSVSLRSPYLLGIFFGIGFLASALSFMLLLGIPPLPLLPGLNDFGFALVVVVLTLIGMAVWTGNLRLRFLVVGFGVGLVGLLVGAYLARMVFFAFWTGSNV